MPSIRSHAILDHSPDKVWSVIRNIGAVADWFPAMSDSEPTQTGRTVTLVDGTILIEEVVTMDDAMRRMQYRVVGGGLPITSHLGTVDVIDLGDGRSLLVYGTDVEPAGIAEAFDNAIGQAVTGLNAHLNT